MDQSIVYKPIMIIARLEINGIHRQSLMTPEVIVILLSEPKWCNPCNLVRRLLLPRAQYVCCPRIFLDLPFLPFIRLLFTTPFTGISFLFDFMLHTYLHFTPVSPESLVSLAMSSRYRKFFGYLFFHSELRLHLFSLLLSVLS